MALSPPLGPAEHEAIATGFPTKGVFLQRESQSIKFLSAAEIL